MYLSLHVDPRLRVSGLGLGKGWKARVRVRRLGLVRVRATVRDTQRWGHIQKPTWDTQRQVS